jgi:hypothetical protein
MEERKNNNESLMKMLKKSNPPNNNTKTGEICAQRNEWDVLIEIHSSFGNENS